MSDSFLLQHLLRRSAEENPGRIAVRSQGRQMTYAELDSLTDRVAATLRKVGVERGARVGIYVPKSVASVVSIYSILKSGAVYVPFDPDAPAERLALIARDCGVRVVLSCTSKMDGINEMVAKGAPVERVVLVDCDRDLGVPQDLKSPASKALVTEWDEARSSPVPPSEESSIEKDTAYILYTSGSTGIPKGVMISHRNSLAFVEWAADCVRLVPEDVVACHAPLHFDISTFSIFSTCKVGGTVLMIPERASTFPGELATLIEREGVTVWYSVPSALTLLTLYGGLEKRKLSKLRAIVFAGEVFPVKFLRQLMTVLPDARYLNWYGPTETNVCTSYEVRHDNVDELTTIPIGKACANTEVFSVSDDGKPVVRSGETGELYVRGPTVMQGYWGDADKTRKLLVPNPINATFGELVYRTGDLVTQNPEGDYVYLGRRDGMIKTRGYRVELGEIEATIYSHPGVKEVVVVPIPDEIVGNTIHAFVSPRADSSITREEVIAHCGARLPRYMIPDTVSFMKSLPKTSSGKMDRVTLSQSLTTGGRKAD